MKSIRRNVFETNSSSTHSLSICSKSDFEAWKAGKVVFSRDGKGGFVSIEEAIAEIKKDNPKFNFKDGEQEDILKDYSFYTYDSYFESDCLEGFEHERNINGVDVVAFGKYGYDG